MYGELLGAWALSAWNALGRPSPFVFAEMGPGRGTMMADMLRVVLRVEPAFLKAATITLIEASDRLARLQIDRLSRFDLPVRTARRIDEVGEGPLVLLANELFDAVAIRQFVRMGRGWAERCVGLGEGGEGLAFALLPLPPEAAARLPDAPAGTLIEVAPARQAIAEAIGRRIARFGGAGLFIDYGHDGGFGDTLQAVRSHGFVDPLERPGEADITSHVDFRALAGAFRAGGALVSPLSTQGDLLLSLGLLERAGRLGSGRDASEQEAIRVAVRRLAGPGPGEMGTLFKAIAVASGPLGVPPFPAAAPR
ncbi:SAM-dependent methyltransferase [Aureimonas sp. Leaf454]|uniref:SAM-dependent methyltransferase n=1 Tax=Aureimonas sp. Leaf454 TaxID=1736381 RepID=UPI001FCE0F55|nr:SAM-dependent methyltransferase [Aureimonas sp. Leaf454]